MTDIDLATEAGLRAACVALGAPSQWDQDRRQWVEQLTGALEWVHAADETTRATRDFQERLWEDNHVAAVGQGNISVQEALDRADFRQWLAERSMQPLPSSRQAQGVFLRELYWDLVERFKSHLSRTKTPKLKIHRVLCALFPAAMTTIASESHLAKLSRALGLEQDDPVLRHVAVRERLDAVLGPHGDNPGQLAERLTLPWMLYDHYVANGDAEVSVEEHVADDLGQQHADEVPLPAARRRRGLTATKGYFQSLLEVLDYLREPRTKAELIEHLSTIAPEAKPSSRSGILNSFQAEFGAIRREGGTYRLTEAGRQTVKTQDPTYLAPWLLGRVLGPDLAIATLRDQGPLSQADLLEAIRRANPGWTTTYMPLSLISWLRSMDVIATVESKNSLTGRGAAWAQLVTWQPERLVADVPQVDPSATVQLPSLNDVASAVGTAGTFPGALVASLHSGLWANKRRHFAVLTGLSGSGKTLLARAYAGAITGNPDAHLLTLPVQPGWYDPSPLLGYVNPLRTNAYVQTPFLQFLLEASRNPERPYVVVLDEMNLSHPEQYMAPLLSAMETGGDIPLYTADDAIEGVPPTLPYPSNLAVIGTVNMDETTHGLSDKVLDRAFVLEFWNVDLDSYPRWDRPGVDGANLNAAREVLAKFLAALQPARLHFGWRVVDDVLDFLTHAQDGGHIPFVEALDAVIYAKILPKLRGEDAPKFRAALAACKLVAAEHQLPRVSAKIAELVADLEATGSARFWR